MAGLVLAPHRQVPVIDPPLVRVHALERIMSDTSMESLERRLMRSAERAGGILKEFLELILLIGVLASAALRTRSLTLWALTGLAVLAYSLLLFRLGPQLSKLVPNLPGRWVGVAAAVLGLAVGTGLAIAVVDAIASMLKVASGN